MFKAYVRLCTGIYPQDMAKNMANRSSILGSVIPREVLTSPGRCPVTSSITRYPAVKSALDYYRPDGL